MRNTTYIYALRYPTSGDIRYVGKANNPKKRFREHLRTDRTASSHKKNWILYLLRKGLIPKLEILEEVPMEDWKERERYYIIKCRKKYKLTNCANGGEGSFRGNQASFKKGVTPWNKGTRKRKACAICGNLFEISPSGDKKYKCCSMKCGNVYKRINPNIGQFKVVPINQYNINSGKFIRSYESIAEAGRESGIGKASITNNVTGRSKSAGGFKWKRRI